MRIGTAGIIHNRQAVMKKITLIAAGALTLSLSSFPQGYASPEEQVAAQPRFCATLISASNQHGNAPYLAQSCSNVSRAEAEAGLREQTDNPVIPDTALMIWYEDASYTGNSNVIYGDGGTCDRAGYRVEPITYWQQNLSSVEPIGACDRNRITSISGSDAATFALPAPNLGRLDNNAGVVQVYSSYNG